MKDKKIKFNEKILVMISLIYMTAPIIIFMVGWLKPIIGITFSVAIIFGIVCYLKKYENDDKYFEISVYALIAIAVIIMAWVWISGIGGYMPQKADWHWRNAILRDLIDYSWPVVYPDTEMGLVYYFTYFLPSALVGKLFGWNLANVTLLMWTILGIILCVLFLCKYLNLSGLKQIVVLMIIFIVWREYDDIRLAFVNLFDATWAYEYTNNNALLQWVTNQTIVPWLATIMFLNNRQIRNYAFLGLCVFAVAPLPFVGFFVLLVFDALVQFVKSQNKLAMVKKEILSIQNIMAIITIFPIFALFYLSNSATTGGAGQGGIGLYMGDGYKGIVALLLFWLFNAIIFSVLIYKEYKKDHLFWIVTISLMIIPLIRIGDGRDFCMRASIPCIFVIMTYVIKYLYAHSVPICRGAVAIWLSLGVFCYSFCCESVNALSTAKHTENKEDFLADQVGSLANKLPYAKCYGICMNMYLTERPYEKPFFAKLCKEKSDDALERDKEITSKYLQTTGFSVISGYYSLYNEEANFNIMLSNTTINGYYQISFEGSNDVLAIGENNTAVLITDVTGWATNNINPNQLFTIEQNGDDIVIRNGDLALTYGDKELKWAPISDEEQQTWKFRPNGREITGESFCAR